jgi:hypothetical protein
MVLARQLQFATSAYMKMKKTNAIGIRMDPDVKDAIEKLAAKDSRSMAQYIGIVLRKHVEQAGALPKPK